jgi:hypothetical protein
MLVKASDGGAVRYLLTAKEPEKLSSNQVGRNVVKRLNPWLPLAAVAVAAACVCGPANAARVGVFVGVGAPYYYPVAPVPYYYPYPPVVAVPAPPVDYVEQGQAQDAGPSADASGQPGGSWYYCEASRAYYPYVKDCPAGWHAVAPRPGNSQ